VATNQNGLQSLEHYALKYSAANVKSENSISFSFFLLFFCGMLAYFYLSFILQSSLHLFFVLSSLSIMIFVLSCYSSFVFLTSYVPFLHFCFCLLRCLSLFFRCLCSLVYLLTERVFTLSSNASILVRHKIDHFKCQGITCDRNRRLS
jgi:hypothetical protein